MKGIGRKTTRVSKQTVVVLYIKRHKVLNTIFIKMIQLNNSGANSIWNIDMC